MPKQRPQPSQSPATKRSSKRSSKRSQSPATRPRRSPSPRKRETPPVQTPTMSLDTTKMLGLGLGIVAVAAFGFRELPGMIADDAEGDKNINALYCATITLATVGYGDICPSNPDPTGKAFVIALCFIGMGFFCGPVMDFAASWRNSVPGGVLGVAAATIGTGVAVFTQLEEWEPLTAAYYCVVTGTTIGYGDVTPKTDNGKLAAALYTLVAVNVVGGLLQPAADFLSKFCTTDITKKGL